MKNHRSRDLPRIKNRFSGLLFYSFPPPFRSRRVIRGRIPLRGKKIFLFFFCSNRSNNLGFNSRDSFFSRTSVQVLWNWSVERDIIS